MNIVFMSMDTLKGLSLINRESIDAIRTAVWELERAGYIRREQGRDAKGKMADMVYTIYEQPVLDKPVLENPVLENPTSDNPTSDNPASGNPTQLNKEIQRTNLPRKEKLNTDGQSTDSIPFPSLTPAPVENEAAAAPPERKGTGKDAAVQIYREILLENIEYDYTSLVAHDMAQPDWGKPKSGLPDYSCSPDESL